MNFDKWFAENKKSDFIRMAYDEYTYECVVSGCSTPRDFRQFARDAYAESQKD